MRTIGPKDGAGSSERGAGPAARPRTWRADRSAARRQRWVQLAGWAQWPYFVWRPLPSVEPGGPGAILSIVHTGYGLAAIALVLDLIIWQVFHLPGGATLVLAHLLWISALTSLLVLNSGFLERLDGRPLTRLGWANRLTLARIAFLPVLVYLLWMRSWSAALGAYVLLALTDVVDGIAARKLGEESKLGFVFDPFVDILFHLGVLLALAARGVLSELTAGLVLARYALLLIGCALLYLTKGEIWIQPTPFGKGSGFGIAACTGLLLLLLGTGWAGPGLLLWLDRVLTVLFGAGLVHVLLIGRVNFMRPAVGGTAVYRRGWGLQLGRRDPPPRTRDAGPPAETRRPDGRPLG